MLLLSLSAPASAQVIFQREKLTISPPPVTNVSKEKEEEKKPEETPRTPQEFMVEVRSEEALNLEYIHTLNDLKDDTGTMISFVVPSIVSVPQMKVYTPVDILFIDPDGIILQILPNITPSEINRDIHASEPVSAFLYLKAGEVKKRDIRPKDVVSHSLFNAKPVILK